MGLLRNASPDPKFLVFSTKRVTLESLKDYKKEDLERFSRIIILVMNNY